ncbi:MAG: protein-L-isoaspartate(D-aspartate) O-methyltransferase [Alphaproteobacteria bacterium]|nr:protein-L-isoaspartate(D-aspartate) O-methyltransferase [Alphaproteobacteria bacterium]
MTSDATRIRLLMELRRQGIGDLRVLSAMERMPREEFVPESFRDRAYENTALPIFAGQTISQPTVVAMMTQALQVGARMKVLEIGTGSGYQAAILSRLCRRVYSIERNRELLSAAEKSFKRLRLGNITTRLGDGSKGWPEQAPFERIIVTAAAAALPMTLAEQLGPGGIMVIPIGPTPIDQQLMRVTRTDAGFTTEDLGPVRFVPLISDLAEPLPARMERS